MSSIIHKLHQKIHTPSPGSSQVSDEEARRLRQREEAKQKEEQHEKHKRELEQKEQQLKQNFAQAIKNDPAAGRYGHIEHSGKDRTKDVEGRERTPLEHITEDSIGDTVLFRARIHSTRRLGSKLAFVVFRHRLQTVQGIVRIGTGTSTEHIAQESSSTPSLHSQYSSAQASHVLDSPDSRDATVSVDRAINVSTHDHSADLPTDLNNLHLGPPITDVTASQPMTATSSADSSISTAVSTAPSSINASSSVTGPNADGHSPKNLLEPISTDTNELPPVSETMVRWVEKLPRETIVLVEGKVKKPEVQGGVKSAEVHQAEIEIYKIFVLSEVTSTLPFGAAQADHVDLDDQNEPHQTVPFGYQLQHRAVSLRTADAHAIFRVTAAVTRAARGFLDSHDFLEIHSAKLQQGATESGASVFKVEYFGREAFLAQSPQLAKEMCIGADLERVYEIGPVFRAENSNTHRHLTEYTGVDLEMAIDSSYHEAMHMIDNMLKHIFRTVQKECAKEIDVVRKKHPSEDLVFPDETVVLTFKQGVQLLMDSGWDEDPPDMDDLSTRAEVRLGALVKEKYNTDYYILDKFPVAARPFYTMPDADNPEITNSFDVFVRGEEIISGGQRIHSAAVMKERLKKAHIAESSMSDYLEAFQAAMPPHAGGGIGLERLVMLFLKLGNIRHATLFPRDPHSFPAPPKSQLKEMAEVAEAALPVPTKVAGSENDQNVLSKDEMKKEKHPKLEDLIAKYGDSTSTAWTDEGYEIWREERHGYAIGFTDSKGHAITWGSPLCPQSALPDVIRDYTDWLKHHRRLKPIWLNCNEGTEQILTNGLHWHALAVTNEQRVSPQGRPKNHQANDDDSDDGRAIEKKVHQAQNKGVTVELIEREIKADLRKEIEDGIARWQENRKSSKQIHTTSIRPFTDAEHRTYLIARNAEGHVVGFTVLHHLAAENGLQIKWSLMFPGAPNGTSELLLTEAMKVMSGAGVKTATFGAGAADHLEAVNSISKFQAKILSGVYSRVSKSFGLSRKTGFREKFGAEEEKLYICYPSHGLGMSGIQAIMGAFKH
ncbi:Putative cytochrome c oxidase, subunit COX19 [Phaffia rhodozyma]|uniref:Probable aspartate--tRNA ligase, cytoplasmic n=1 Tax=Phaffia rhodozyma TaxID=264483 RepID=A0A0F7SQ69_PHARH|nr:Putative cytochrome c oxidase, subunit COX19 [Phaffia rhodozyma]